MRALTLIGCRLLAVFAALQAFAQLPSLMRALVVAGAPARALLMHADVVACVVLAALLWFAAAPLARFAARAHPLPSVSVGAAAPHLVRFAGAAIVVVAFGRLLAGVLRWLLEAPDLWDVASAAARAATLTAGAGLIIGAASVAQWLASGLRDADDDPAPLPREDASIGALIGDLVGAAGLLGVRRVSELAQAVRAEAEDVARRVVRSSLDRVIAAVEQRHPDFSAATAADGTVTIVFSDMEGFTAMTERLGDHAAHQIIKTHNRIVRRAVQRHGGQEVELQGDGFLLAFPEAAQALACTAEIQRQCAEFSRRHADTPIRVRIGVHCGTPIQEGDRFFGITVILAARIAGQAAGSEVLVSDDVRTAVAAAPSIVWAGMREAPLKGVSGVHRMHVLDWRAR